MSSNKIMHHYISNIDLKLAEFDRTHTPSQSQQAEIKKYKRIYQLRDQAVSQEHQADLWDFKE